jgi:4-hydroxyphenylpyruvate dioxygenase
MTSYSTEGLAPPDHGASMTGFDHVRWVCGNAKQAASFYVARMGFTHVAYKGLETGSRDVCAHVVQQGRIRFVLSSPLHSGSAAAAAAAGSSASASAAAAASGADTPAELNAHLAAHGDGVKDVAFAVSDCRAIFAAAVKRGAAVVAEPREERDAHGAVVLATVRTYGDTLHSFVQRLDYAGPFLPGFRAVDGAADPALAFTPPVGLSFIDHVVGNMPDLGMEPAVRWYEDVLQFHRFWSVDDRQMSTEHSALRSVVVADHSERVKMPINEPAPGKRKSQIQEYCEFYGGAGVQHIALNTPDIITAITRLRARGMGFLRVPDTYYAAMEEKLKAGGIALKEDIAAIRRLNILVDFDEKGYLLQLFTAPIQDRPT